jgi:hypothetical protein
MVVAGLHGTIPQKRAGIIKSKDWTGAAKSDD